MSQTFQELYGSLSNEIILERVRQQLTPGTDSQVYAESYIEQGKPDFVLAYLLLSDAPDELKRQLLARAYEQRAILSEEKAEDFTQKFQRPFPLIKLEAQKDRMSAQQIRQGRRVHRGGKALNVN